MALTQVDQGLLGQYAQYTGFKNRIINGAMVIDQRNAGASVTPADGAYTLDRWYVRASQASKFSVQQNAGSVTPPVGYTNYLGVTSLSAYTVGASEFFNVTQAIEGFNIADLGWGTANAAPVTVSFWVRSSLTGTFGGTLFNNGTRFYPFTYTINSANTWEQKTLTIAGDTTGTWLTNNGVGLQVVFSLGAGATVSGTAGTWSGTVYRSATGATSVVGTNGATFYITGVQLEKGSTATSFDYRPYGTELQLCQRYYEASGFYGVYGGIGTAGGAGNNNSRAFTFSGNDFKVTKRATPTMSFQSAQSGTATKISGYSSGTEYTVNDASGTTTIRTFLYLGTTVAMSSYEPQAYYWQASAEL